jgi:hypothetical protein
MKKMILTGLLAGLTSAAQAEPALMLGISHNFGGATGLTFKVLSTRERNKPALALGLSYFPGAGEARWGLDTGLAYTFDRAALALGYDWFNQQTQLSVGAANTRQPTPAPGPTATSAAVTESAAAPTPASAPAPAKVVKKPVAAAPAPTPAPDPVDTCAKASTGCAG